MIKKIALRQIPPYLGDEQIVEPKIVNFLFGLNGSGKTTISRYLQNPDKPEYRDCCIEWDNSISLKCAVYNRDYVTANFSDSSMQGIFTLGEENIEVKRQISELNSDIEKLQERENSLKTDLNGNDVSAGLLSELSKIEKQYTDKFWGVKQQIDKDNSPISLSLEGFRGSKEVFKNNLLQQFNNNTSESKDKGELETLCTQLYGSGAEFTALIPVPSFETLLNLENTEILQKIIVGKDDVDIASLIKKLGNDAWVKQGAEYLENSDGKCPFCQRPLNKDFADKIAEYFDQSYLLAVQEVRKVKDTYIRVSDSLLTEIGDIKGKESEFIKNDELELCIEQFKRILEGNKRKLDDKVLSPNLAIKLESSSNMAKSILAIIKNANEAISEHNNRIANIKVEKEKATSLVWRYILNLISNDIETYNSEKKRLSDTISDKNSAIQEIEIAIKAKNDELRSLEQRLTSILPTATGINTLLQNYGFTGFSLAVNDSEKSYQLVRENGVPAFDSLSEGERNFVTFLYFMCSLRGNTDESGHNDDKVVIVDDPVSSLDNDVLFLVSSLLRDLFKDIYAGEGTIKQLFIFSHNSYFFKEVSYKQGLNYKKTGYWMIVKSNNQSRVLAFDNNPVTSTYEMLWSEIKNAKFNPHESNTLSLANTMRRILEHYFNLLGGMDLSKIHLSFPDGERQVFKSLISWANAGSHSAFDDYSATPNLYDTQNYLKVFRDLFEKTGHIAHYNMMMKIATEENEDGQA